MGMIQVVFDFCELIMICTEQVVVEQSACQKRFLLKRQGVSLRSYLQRCSGGGKMGVPITLKGGTMFRVCAKGVDKV